MKHIVVLGCLLALAVGCNAIAGIEPATLDDNSLDQIDLPTEDASSGPGAACDVTSRLCNNRCVARDDPAFGCGKATCAPCDVSHARAGCTAGVCVVAKCATGFADCNGDPSDGCEADLTNPQTCGACTAKCSSSLPLCALGSCRATCPSQAPTRCGSTCTDLRADASHCGACGNVCAAAMACVNGACQ